MHIPLEKAHLNLLTKENDPLVFEQLCVRHDTIKPDFEGPDDGIDSSMLEFLFEKPTEQWDSVSY